MEKIPYFSEREVEEKHSVVKIFIYFCNMKKIQRFSERKAEVNYLPFQSFISMPCISLPTFPFEFSVEQASNRMIDIRGLIKVLKHIQLSFIVLLFHLQKYEKI
jgi:hypothetical protein